jgi:hypothetical protein
LFHAGRKPAKQLAGHSLSCGVIPYNSSQCCKLKIKKMRCPQTGVNFKSLPVIGDK